MSKKSDVVERQRALGLRVVCNDSVPASAPSSRSRPCGLAIATAGVPSESDYPAGSLTVASVDGNSDAVEVQAATYASWLEEQYHGNVAPFSFLGEVPLQLVDMPEQAVVDLAIKLLRRKGWGVGELVEFKASGTRAASIVLMHPDSRGF